MKYNAIQTNMAQKYVVQKMSNIQKSSNKNGSLNFGSHDKLGSETLKKKSKFVRISLPGFPFIIFPSSLSLQYYIHMYVLRATSNNRIYVNSVTFNIVP